MITPLVLGLLKAHLSLQAVLSRRHHDDRQTDRQAEEPQRPTELTSASSGKERERASLEKGQK